MYLLRAGREVKYPEWERERERESELSSERDLLLLILLPLLHKTHTHAYTLTLSHTHIHTYTHTHTHAHSNTYALTSSLALPADNLGRFGLQHIPLPSRRGGECVTASRWGVRNVKAARRLRLCQADRQRDESGEWKRECEFCAREV